MQSIDSKSLQILLEHNASQKWDVYYLFIRINYLFKTPINKKSGDQYLKALEYKLQTSLPLLDVNNQWTN